MSNPWRLPILVLHLDRHPSVVRYHAGGGSVIRWRIGWRSERFLSVAHGLVENNQIGIPAGSGLFVHYDSAAGDPATLGVGSSEASIFGLKSSSYSRATNESNHLLNFTNSTSAIAVWKDFIVTGPAGPSTVPISVKSLIEGSIAASMGSGYSPTSRLGGSVQFYIESGLQNDFFWTISYGGTYEVSVTPSGGPVYDNTGLLANFDGSTVVTTGVFSVPVNTPFAIRFGLSTAMVLRTQYSSVFSMEVGVDFSHTAKFVTDGPAFSLPVGYTINSVDCEQRLCCPGAVDHLVVGFRSRDNLYRRYRSASCALSSVSLGV